MGKTVLLIGSTGLVGSHLLRKLVNDSHYSSIITPVRRSSERIHEKHRPVLFDFDAFTNVEDLSDFDTLFICIGTTIKKAGSQEKFKKVDFDYPANFIDLAEKSGCRCVALVSSVGADSDSSIFYSRVKGELEDHLRSKNISAKYILRPGFIIGDRQESRPLEKLGGGFSVVLDKIFGRKMGAFRPTKAEDIAEAMLKLSLIDINETRILDSNEIGEGALGLT